jgi:hypothetical protein
MIRAMGYLCWLLFPTFYGFLLGFIFWGIKSALTSGTLQALVYDELKYYQQEKQFTKIWGRMQTLSFVAILIASFLASPAILWGYSFVLVISAAAVGLSGLSIMGYSVKSPSLSKRNTPYFSVLKLGFRNAFKDRLIGRLILFMAIVIALNGGLDEYWPIFAKEVGVPNYALGLVFGVMSIGEALGSYYAHYFEKRNLRFIYWLTLFNGLLLLLASWIYEWPTLTMLLVFSLFFSVINVILEGKLHHAIEEETRATVSSISGFLTELMVIGVYAGFGALSQLGNYQLGFLSFGVLIMLVSLIYLSFNWTIQKPEGE